MGSERFQNIPMEERFRKLCLLVQIEDDLIFFSLQSFLLIFHFNNGCVSIVFIK